MRFERISLEKHIEKLDKELKGNSFYVPILLNSRTLLFPNKEKRNHYLVISLNKETPLIYEAISEQFYTSFENEYYLVIKKEIDEITVLDIFLDKTDYIVYLFVEHDELHNNKREYVKFEMFPHNPHLSIVQNVEAHNDKKDEALKTEVLNNDILSNHFKNELIIRKKEKYHNFLTYISSKIKAVNRKIDAINKDVLEANNKLKYQQLADNMFTLGLNLKMHYKTIDIYGENIALDESKTLIENIEHFYKLAKKAKTTIEKSNQNLLKANEELTIYQEMKDRFDNTFVEKELDRLVNESGMVKKKKETKETIFNRPYKINFNGTIIYFGRNASQNDYLSFVMKTNRDFYWLHIKDKPGSHILICNVKPTEKELILASEVALIASKATSGEITYTKKKNVKRGHKLGEAILKNYSTIKINNINKDSYKIFEEAIKA